MIKNFVDVDGLGKIIRKTYVEYDDQYRIKSIGGLCKAKDFRRK